MVVNTIISKAIKLENNLYIIMHRSGEYVSLTSFGYLLSFIGLKLTIMILSKDVNSRFSGFDHVGVVHQKLLL